MGEGRETMKETVAPPGYLTTRDLIAKGWSAPLIKKLLPKPCAVQNHSRGVYRITRNLYEVERIEALMQSPEFAEAQANQTAHAAIRAAAPERRRNELDRKYSSWRAALPEACVGLHSANRYAKHNTCSAEHRAEIYRLKNAFVELLYKCGYCTACFEHVLVLPAKLCRDCGGQSGTPEWRRPTRREDGWGCDDGYCERCDNTGIYLSEKRLTFYCFKVAIGRGYLWHQPDSLVNWPVVTTQPPADWTPGDREKPLLVSRAHFAEVKDLLRWVLEKAEAEPDKEPEYLPARDLVTMAGEQEGLF